MRRFFAGIGLGLVALVAGCSAPAPAPFQPAVARFFLETRPGEDGVAVTLPESAATIAVGAKPVLFESDLVNAEVVQVDLGRCLMVELTPAAARDLYRLSVAASGRRLVLAVDNRAVGARRIDQPLPDGRLLVFVELPDDQLPLLVARLKRSTTDLALAPSPARGNPD